MILSQGLLCVNRVCYNKESWRDGRADEGDGLENRSAMSAGGSNPSPSANDTGQSDKLTNGESPLKMPTNLVLATFNVELCPGGVLKWSKRTDC